SIRSLICMRRVPGSTLFPYTTLFRSFRWFTKRLNCSRFRQNFDSGRACSCLHGVFPGESMAKEEVLEFPGVVTELLPNATFRVRSEEHTSELQSRENLVCRLLLEKKK